MTAGRIKGKACGDGHRCCLLGCEHTHFVPLADCRRCTPHEATGVEVWQYPDGLAAVYAWSCDCEPTGAGDGGYPSLREALKAALAHVTEAPR